MDSGVLPSPDPVPGSSAQPRAASRSAFRLFQDAAREHPLRASLGLGAEYAMFAAGMGLALALFATRAPMRLIDRTFGLSLRERFVELLARVSPG